MKVLITLAGAAFAASTVLAGPALAERGERRETRVTIVDLGDEGNRDRSVERVVVRSGGRDGVTVNDCRGEPLVDIDERADGRRTRILMCGAGGDPAARAGRLAELRARIAGDERLSGRHRQRVLAAIDSAIARQRAE